MPEDVAVLPDIERLAARLFKTCPGDLGIPENLYDAPNSVETFAAAQRAGRLWVATASGGELVGFAAGHGHRGLRSPRRAQCTPCTWRPRSRVGASRHRVLLAKGMGYPAVTLRTFRDVPWNAPFYQSRGFRIVDSATLSAAHVGLEASERQRGLRTDIRVTMAHQTAG